MENFPAHSKKHSKLGIVSCVLAIAVGAISLLLFAVTFIPERGTYTEKRFDAVAITFGLLIAPVLHSTGLILGIVGTFLKDSKRTFAVLGIILNLLPLLLALIVWILLFWVVWAVISSGGGWR